MRSPRRVADTVGRHGISRRFASAAVLLALLGLLAGLGLAQAQPAPQRDPDEDRLGLKHLEDVKARDLNEVAEGEVTTRVLATEDRWQSSGVLVRKGQTYKVAASGEWQVGPFCNKTGPGGVSPYTLLCLPLPLFPPVIEGFSHSTLIAKVGRDGKPFGVGEQYGFEAQEDGVLFFRVNDTRGGVWENSGQASVKVSLLAPRPAPAQAARPAEAPPARSEAAAPAATAAGVQHWAVVVGISDYADSQIPALRYAAADARAFYDWLVSPAGGRYAPARVRLLLDREATAAAMKDALYNWLRQAIDEDIVIIYFAGHGSPDSPDTPQNLYLLPFDTRYDSIAATGFPMWDIETALKRFIKARRVVVIADACHSGGVGQSFDLARRAAKDPGANRISAGLQGLTAVGSGIAVLSASDDKQLSAESAKFGGGHGVFTHYLLQGLQGRADYNGDSRVTLGELIPYLSEHVRRETQNAQSPTVAGRFDPALAIGR